MENQIENNVFSDDKISTAGIKQESSFTRALRKNRVLLMMLIPAFLYFFSHPDKLSEWSRFP